MQRYFFHRADGPASKDTEGTELSDLAEAQREAVIYAAETLKDQPETVLDGGEFQVEVADDRGTVLFVVKVSASV